MTICNIPYLMIPTPYASLSPSICLPPFICTISTQDSRMCSFSLSYVFFQHWVELQQHPGPWVSVLLTSLILLFHLMDYCSPYLDTQPLSLSACYPQPYAPLLCPLPNDSSSFMTHSHIYSPPAIGPPPILSDSHVTLALHLYQ